MAEWSSVDELADELGVPARSIYSWRVRGKGPRAHKIGKYLRFRRADVEAWLAEQVDDRPSAA